MHFPIEAPITKSSPDYPTANILRVDGNAGQIPPSFQYALIKREAEASDTVVRQGVTQMTSEQWNAWQSQSDSQYVLTSIAANIGIEIGPMIVHES